MTLSDLEVFPLNRSSINPIPRKIWTNREE